MRPPSALVSEVRRLLAGEQADRRVAQAVFLVPVLLDTAIRWWLTGRLGEAFQVGVVVTAVPTLAAVAIALGHVGRRWIVWLPVLDMVALGTFRVSEDSALGIAVAVPAIWLGLEFGRRGVLVAVATTLLAFAVPTLAYHGVTFTSLSRISQTMLLAAACSAIVATTASLWRTLAAESRTSSSRLAHAVEDVIEQRRLTESIVRSVDVGLVALDAQGAYETMNPRQEDFMRLAFPQGHAGQAGQTGFVYAADGTTRLTREEMPTTRATRGESFRDHLIWVGQEPEQRRALAVSASPYVDQHGVFSGAILGYHDITELVAAARIKDEFVASVSHELRTPLTSIIGYVDLVLDDADDVAPDVRAHLDVVRRNARRLQRLVDDLLSTALHSVTTVLELEVVGVRSLVERSALEAGKVARAAGHTFDLDLRCGELPIQGDEERLAQVFDNLFSNAIKYTPSGGHVEGVVLREGDEAVVQVRDTGRGISEAELDEVFEKFFRSSAVASEAIPGVGLGLAITKAIVDAHGGRIGVESKLGQGTTFEVRLPLAGPPVRPA